MPNLKYLNINGVNYSLGRDTKVYYGSTSETITDLVEGDLLIDSETGTTYRYSGSTWVQIATSGGGSGLSNLEDGSSSGAVKGINTTAEDGTYVMGQNAVAVGGSTQAAGANSFTSGLGTVAQRGSQAVFGEYNTLDTTGSTSTRGDYAFIIGNGTSNARSNATTIDWEGSMDTHGAITAGSIDNGYGLNDQALLASDTIALWEDIING